MVIKTASPGVFLKETDLTRGVADAITQNVGVVAGPFQKGPVDQLTYITQEVEFRRIFGEPTDQNYEYWWSVNNFLEYSGNCYVVRCDDAQGDSVDAGSGILHQQTMRNSTDDFSIDETTGDAVSAVYMKNDDAYITEYLEQGRINPQWGRFLSRNPGTWANGIGVAVIDKGADYQVTLKSAVPNIGTDNVNYVNAGSASNTSDNTVDGNPSNGTYSQTYIGGIAESAGEADVDGVNIVPTTINTPPFPGSTTEVGESIAKYAKVLLDPDTFSASDYETNTYTQQYSRFPVENIYTSEDWSDRPGSPPNYQLRSDVNSNEFPNINDVTQVKITPRKGFILLQKPDGSYPSSAGLPEGNTDSWVQTDPYILRVRNGEFKIFGGRYIQFINFTKDPSPYGDEYMNGINYKLVNLEVTYSVGGPLIRIGNGASSSIGVVTKVNEQDPQKPFITVAFAKNENNQYGSAFDGDAFDEPIIDVSSSNVVGKVQSVTELGDFLYYNKVSNQVLDIIFEPKTYTRDEGIQWFWPNRPFDGEKVFDGKVAVDLQGSPLQTEDSTPSNPLYVTLQGPALVTTVDENPISWNARRELWESSYTPEYDDILYAGTVGFNDTPQIYQINTTVDWYSQQIAFEGIPWRSFGPRPGTSASAQDRGCSDDEMNIIVYDALGNITGQKGSTIEQHMLVSKLRNATTIEGSNNFYKDIINSNSSVLFSNRHLETLATYINDGKVDPGTPIGNNLTCKLLVPRYGSSSKNDINDIAAGNTFNKPYLMLGAVDQLTASLGEIQAGYEKVIEENVSDLDYIIQGPAYDTFLFESLSDSEKYAASVAKANYLITLGERLKTAMVVISPPRSAALEPINAGTITKRIIQWANQISSSSYAIIDSGYKYMYDRFDDKYRYIPLNSDIAGVMTQTSLFSEPFFSPAGMSRGQIRNVVKLGYDPSKDQRDQLYTSRVNSVVTFPGEGTVLYGDKTALSYSSAFNRINVRKLFIYCERQIAKIAKSVLFEFNDVPTRVNFKNNVNPFLRDVQSKRGAVDFLVVCDDSNNTPEVIDRNEFVADIYIKPNRSINFVQLNFVATKSGVSFSEAIGLNRRVEGLQ